MGVCEIFLLIIGLLMFIGWLTGLLNASKHKKYVSLRQNPQHTLINLHPNEYTQGLCYYPFVFNLDRCVGSFNTLNDLSNKVCNPNKTKNLNLSLSKIITGINEFETLRKHISC